MQINAKNKFYIYFLLPLIVILTAVFLLLFPKMKSVSEQNFIEDAQILSENYSVLIQNKLVEDFNRLYDFAELTENANILYGDFSQFVNEYLKDILIKNRDYESVWLIYSGNEDKKHIIKYFRSKEKLEAESRLLAEDDLDYSSYFSVHSSSNSNLFIEDTKNDTNTKGIKLVLTVPVFTGEEIDGLAGIEIPIDKLRNSYSSFLTYNKRIYNYITDGNVLINLDEETGPIKAIESNLKTLDFLNTGVLGGDTYFYIDEFEKEFLIHLIPIHLISVKNRYYLVTSVRSNDKYAFLKMFTRNFILFSLIGLLVSFLFLVVVINSFFKQLLQPINVLKAMSEGIISKVVKLPKDAADPVNIMNESINKINFSLDKTADFIQEISKGNFDYQYTPLFKEDRIGNLLIDLKNSIEKTREEEKRRKAEDERLNWATGGSAMFAEIIREHSDNLEELAYAIISELVNYIDANQGGIFIINEDEQNEKFIELLSSFAYDRKKMLEKKIPFGAGLVGRCILEKETIYMTNVPKDYLNITSGLGTETAGTLLLVPLIFHEDVFGVVELAAFKEIEEYKIKLVEQISEGIASAISMVKINVRTAELLKETKIKSEQAASQEEEIRQNIEEMQASTDELNKKLDHVTSSLNAIKSVAHIAEFDMQGRVTDISESFLNLLNMKKEDVIGKFQGSFSAEASNLESFNNFWKDLRKGKTLNYQQVIQLEKELLNIESIYIPLKDSDGKVFKVISITDKK